MSEETEPKEGQERAEIAKLLDENKRLVKTIQGFQAKEAEFDKFKSEIEKSKLSEADRQKAEFEQLKREREAALLKAQEAEQRLATQDKINDLVAFHGLKNPEFGSVLLKNLKEDEDLDEFAKRMKASPKYRDVFRSDDGGSFDVEEPREKKKAPPAQSSGVPKRGKAAEITEDDRAFAARRFPKEPERQKALLERLLRERRGE